MINLIPLDVAEDFESRVKHDLLLVRTFTYSVTLTFCQRYSKLTYPEKQRMFFRVLGRVLKIVNQLKLQIKKDIIHKYLGIYLSEENARSNYHLHVLFDLSKYSTEVQNEFRIVFEYLWQSEFIGSKETRLGNCFFTDLRQKTKDDYDKILSYFAKCGKKPNHLPNLRALENEGGYRWINNALKKNITSLAISQGKEPKWVYPQDIVDPAALVRPTFFNASQASTPVCLGETAV